MSEQTTPFRIARFLLAASVTLAYAQLRAQAYTPPPPPLTGAPCKPTKKDPCTAPNTTPPAPVPNNKLDFPGEPPKDGTPSSPGPTDPSTTSAPQGTAPSKPDPADRSFPFPGETPDSASSSSSSSSSSPKNDDPQPDDPTPPPPVKDATPVTRRHKLAKVEDLDAREAKDIEVSGFYLSTGNYLGAYARAKDAIRLYPDDPEAHFALAAAAQKLKKNDEAVTEYKSYLKLEPDGDHVKVAQHALAEIH